MEVLQALNTEKKGKIYVYPIASIKFNFFYCFINSMGNVLFVISDFLGKTSSLFLL